MFEVKLMVIGTLVTTIGLIYLCAYGIQYFTAIPFSQAMMAVSVLFTLSLAFMAYKDGRRMREIDKERSRS